MNVQMMVHLAGLWNLHMTSMVIAINMMAMLIEDDEL